MPTVPSNYYLKLKLKGETVSDLLNKLDSIINYIENNNHCTKITTDYCLLQIIKKKTK
jgi:hypothetical protein